MRIAVWTYTERAFGQVYRAIAKYSKHDITLLDWRKKYTSKDFEPYDLINIPTPECYFCFIRRFPEHKHKTFCSLHGTAELWNYNPATGQKNKIIKPAMDTEILPQDMVININSRMQAVGCISKELVNLIQPQTKAKAFYTPCGADPDLFSSLATTLRNPLTVICPIPRNQVNHTEHGYNVKRWNLVLEIEKQLPDVKFLFLDNRVDMDEIAEFYKKGDIILCLSHSEGNPLGVIEAGMMGVLPITTKVGEVPAIFTNDENAILLDSTTESELIKECVDKISKLNDNRDKLITMQLAARQHLLATRTWDKVIDKWDNFFEKCMPPKGVKMSKKLRFHLLGLPHLPTSKLYNACAFTQKNVKLAKMLMDLGHEVFVYGVKTNVGEMPKCTEFIETHTIHDIRADYGDGDNDFEIGYDWQAGEFRHDINKPRKPSTLKYYANCVTEINKRKCPDDFLLITQGSYQKQIDKGVNLKLTCEPGIGYRGSYCGYRAFESSYIQNFTYGSQHPYQSLNGNYWDRLIPNYFDSDDLEVGNGRGDYYLYIGRMISRKGISTAVKACNHLGVKLLLVGQGGKVNPDGSFSGDDFKLSPGTWEYMGYADFEKRKGLFANAIATFVCTLYLEPFAGVHIESMLSGTPVITTNFGVFPETVINGVNGFRCDVLQDFVDAAIKCKELDRRVVRKSAEQYLCENVALQYNKWFTELHNLYESMVDSSKLAWHRLED